jgi:hypothetical protein
VQPTVAATVNGAGLLVTFTEWQRLWEGPIGRQTHPPSAGLFFVMTDELMLFLALAGGFTVVLVEWWARQTP